VLGQLLLLSSFDPLELDLDVFVVDVSLLVFVALGFVVTFVVGVGPDRRAHRSDRGRPGGTVGGGLLVVGATDGAAAGGSGGAAGSCEDDELNSDAGAGGAT